MDKFIKDDGLLKGKGESDVDWITTDNGTHIPIKPGQSKKDAINEQFKNNQSTVGQEKKDVVAKLTTSLKKVAESKYKVSKPKIADLIKRIINFEPITLQIGDREIIARFDRYGARENFYGDKFSDKEGYLFKKNNVDNLPEYIKTATYSYSQPEKGKDTPAHKDVKEWHYFINEIHTNEGDFDIVINVRDKGESQFVYLVTFNKK